jgi:hypothetical protein
MSYVTVTEVKDVLGITGTSQDAKIAMVTEGMESLLDNMLGVDSLNLTEYTDERVSGTNSNWLALRNHEITEVSTIKTFGYDSDVEVTGLTVRRYEGRRAYFDYTFYADIDYLVTYTAGYRPIPAQLKLCIAYMVSGALSASEQKPGVQAYSILGKSVTFTNDKDYQIFKSVISKYAVGYKKAGAYQI